MSRRRSDCGGPCLSGDDSALSSPVAGRHFIPRDHDVTAHLSGCHDDACCVAKSLLLHDDCVSNNTTSTTAVRSSSPQARLLYDSRPAPLTNSCSNVHAVVFSSKHEQANALPVACDCAAGVGCDAADRLAQNPSLDDGGGGVQYYVIDRRKLASAMRLPAASSSLKRTSPTTDDMKQLRLMTTRATENGAKQPGGARSLVGECRPLLVVTPGECCRNQRYSQVPPAAVGNSNESES